MLDELSISSLGVIEAASLEFGPGLNVVTGETGAGKTMVVTALGLLLGARADPGIVRAGEPWARVEGRIRVASQGAVAARAVAAGAALDDDSLLLARTVSGEGRSKARAGGAGVPAATLAALAADLVVIHGQSDQQQLLLPSRQRQSLDAYGDETSGLRLGYQAVFDRLKNVERDLEEVVTRAREHAQEADMLRFGLGEIGEVAPQPDEDAELRAEESRLGHVDGLRRAAEAARVALAGHQDGPDAVDALALVAVARKSLESERDHDPRLAQLAEALAGASYALADAAADIASYSTSLDTDPARLGWVQDRRAVLGGLFRKYGDTVAEVLSWSERSVKRLTELEGDDARVDDLRAERERLRASLLDEGGRLTRARRHAADDLATRVSAELHGLAMPHAKFDIAVTELPEPLREGLDEVGFLLAAHDGAEARPLQRGASGGELSRVMLALEVCLAGTEPVPTMIFDEVDAGVGGKAAVEVGRRLARLARSVQVVVVTHLPQVAAFADQHYVVVKSSDGSVTTSGVRELDEAGRRSELSRMLAGLEDSETALAHADELVRLAERERGG